MTDYKTLAASFMAAVTLAGPAVAQSTCMSRDVIVDRLKTTYSEELIGRGLQGTNRLFEVFMARDGSTWTIVQTMPTGVACIMAAGTHWQHDDIATAFGVEG